MSPTCTQPSDSKMLNLNQASTNVAFALAFKQYDIKIRVHVSLFIWKTVQWVLILCIQSQPLTAHNIQSIAGTIALQTVTPELLDFHQVISQWFDLKAEAWKTIKNGYMYDSNCIPRMLYIFSKSSRTSQSPAPFSLWLEGHHLGLFDAPVYICNAVKIYSRTPNLRYAIRHFIIAISILIHPLARFVGPTWSPSGAARIQVGPMLAPWTLLSGHPSFPFRPNTRRGGGVNSKKFTYPMAAL